LSKGTFTLTDSVQREKWAVDRAQRELLVKQRLEHRRKRKTDQCKVDTVKTYLALGGNLTLTAAATGISRNTLKVWKTSNWWDKLIKEFRKEERLDLSVKTKKILEKSMEQLADRLEGGDYLYDPKARQLVRKPVGAKDLHRIAVDMIDRKEKIDKAIDGYNPDDEKNNEDKLSKLAEQFAQLAITAVKNKDKPKMIEVTDVIFVEEKKNA